MPLSNAQLGAAAAAIGGIGYFLYHQRNKNAIDKVSDRFEQSRYAAREAAGDSSMSTQAGKVRPPPARRPCRARARARRTLTCVAPPRHRAQAYYDAKESARKA